MTRASFELAISNFSGPFELLLDLISKRELDLTTLALAEVTDEFIAHTRALGDQFADDLGAVTEFLVIAATLLQLKASRLLPSPEPEDPEELALLEARDVLFAKLLQYRAYRAAAERFVELMADSNRRFPSEPVAVAEAARAPKAKPASIGVDVRAFARIAADALAPKPVPEVSTGHMHTKPVSVAEQAALLFELLRSAAAADELGGREPGQWRDFAELAAGLLGSAAATGGRAGSREMWVARFLAVLRLHGEAKIEVEQDAPLAPLRLRAVAAA